MSSNSECPNCKRLQEQLDSVHVRLAAVEQELRSGKRQAGLFSRDKSKSEPKKPGRKKGEGPFNHRKPPSEDEIDRTESVSLDACPDCGGCLTDKQVHENIQIDIPRVSPEYVRFVTESGYCPCCCKRVRSRHPQQTSTAGGSAGVSIGPNAKAFAADLKHRMGVPYAKIAEILKTVFGLPVTPGGLCQADERLAEKAKPIYTELIEAIRQSCAVHADETGWRIGLLSTWLWVFTNEHITVYTIKPSRGHDVVVNILGREFGGVLHADCFRAYDHKKLSDWVQQKCFAHFLKTLSRMEQEKTRAAVCFPRQVATVLRQALALQEAKSQIPPRAFTRRLRKIERALDGLIDEGRSFSDPDNARFAKRLRKQRRHLFTFLTHDQTQPTNNRAERAIRPAVIVRKTGGCNKTTRGAETHAVLSSILVTAKQQKRDILDYLRSILTATDTPPPLLVATDSS